MFIFLKNSFLNTVAEFARAFLDVIPAMFLARALGVEGRGIYSLILLFYGTLAFLGRGGLDIGVVYFLNRYKQQEKNVLGAVLLASWGLALTTIVGFLIVYLFLSGKYFHQITLRMIWPALAMIPVNVGIYTTSSFLVAQKRIKELSFIKIGSSFLFAFLVTVAFLLNHLNLTTSLVMYLGVDFVNYVLILSLVISTVGVTFNRSFQIAKEIIQHSIKFHLGGVLHYLMARTNIYILAISADARAVGFFSVALITERAAMITQAVGTVFLAEMAEEKNRLSAKTKAEMVIRHMLWLMILILIVMFVGRSFLIKVLFGSSFLPAGAAWAWLLPGVLFLSLAQVVNPYIYGFAGESFLFAKTNTMTLIASLILGFLLIPRFKESGAAMTLSGAYGFYFFITLTQFIRKTKSSLKKVVLLQKEDWERISRWFNKLFCALRFFTEKTIVMHLRRNKKPIFVLSFDLDLDNDYKALPIIFGLLKKYELKVSFVCIGKYVERYPKLHLRMIKEGHEIVNHSWEHPDHPEFFPDKKFNQVSKKEREKQIMEGDKIIRNVLRYQSIGFRAPHFAFTKDIYLILDKLGYKYSSSRLEWQIGVYGRLVKIASITEIPLSADSGKPWEIVDTYSLFRSNNKVSVKQAENILNRKLDSLLKQTLKSKSISTVFWDPVDIVKLNNPDKLFKTISKFRNKGVKIYRYQDII